MLGMFELSVHHICITPRVLSLAKLINWIPHHCFSATTNSSVLVPTRPCLPSNYVRHLDCCGILPGCLCNGDASSARFSRATSQWQIKDRKGAKEPEGSTNTQGDVGHDCMGFEHLSGRVLLLVSRHRPLLDLETMA